MAVTQYIGARYVPLFADPLEWDSSNTYEPLTIVLHEGASYTSRQYVPVGIDISNEEFWALTGNYNAQIEQYRLEVAQYVEQVETFADDIADSVKYDVNITTTEPEAPYDNCDTFPTNTVIRIAQAGAAEYVQNLPTEESPQIILTIGATDIEGGIANAQFVIVQNEASDFYWRTYSSAWNAWSHAADYETLQTALEEFRSEVDSFKTEVTEDIDALTTDYNEFKEQTTSDLETNLETSLTGKTHIVCIGDSFTSDVVRDYSWPTQLPSVYTVHNYASGGTGFVTEGSQTTGESNHTFPEQAQDAVADTSYNHDLVKTCIVYGGYNDFRNYADEVADTDSTDDFYSNIRSAINETTETLYNEFPGADIIVVIGNNGFGDRANAAYYNFFNATLMRGTTNSHHYTMVNAMYWLYGFGESSVFNDDELHPNSAGAHIIARYMTDLINGCFDPSSLNIYTVISRGEDEQHSLYARFNPEGDFNFVGNYTFSDITSTGDNYATLSSIADGRFTQYYGQSCIPLKTFVNGQSGTNCYFNPSNGRFHIMAIAVPSSNQISTYFGW